MQQVIPAAQGIAKDVVSEAIGCSAERRRLPACRRCCILPAHLAGGGAIVVPSGQVLGLLGRLGEDAGLGSLQGVARQSSGLRQHPKRPGDGQGLARCVAGQRQQPLVAQQRARASPISRTHQVGACAANPDVSAAGMRCRAWVVPGGCRRLPTGRVGLQASPTRLAGAPPQLTLQ